jgi:hypothetical protein
MQLKTIEAVSVVHQIRCDRCGKEAERGEVGFQEMTSIGFDAGYGSICANPACATPWPPCLRRSSPSCMVESFPRLNPRGLKRSLHN